MALSYLQNKVPIYLHITHDLSLSWLFLYVQIHFMVCLFPKLSWVIVITNISSLGFSNEKLS